MAHLLLITVLAVIVVARGQIKLDASGAEGSQQMMSFKTPTLTAEEMESNFMPKNLKCDACNAVAFQFHKHFEEFNSNHKSYNYKLPESEVIDLVEKVCHHETFHNYGVKEVDGVNRLSGAGLMAESAAAMLSGGGKWPARLSNECSKFIEEMAETEIYELYLNGKESAQQMQKLMCYGEGLLGQCTKKRKISRKIHTEL